MKRNIAILLLGSISLAACGQVDTGHRGIFVNYGKPTGQVGEGLQWYNPITTDLIQLDVRQLAWESQTDIYTKDVQQARVTFKLTYHLDPGKVMDVYQGVGEEWAATIVPQVVQQAVKNKMGQARAVEDVINNRQVVGNSITADITAKLRKKHVIVDGFEIQDVSFTKAFESSVERKQIAVQDAETARNQTVKIKEEATQRVIAANADAEAMKIKTQALAGNAKLVEYEAVQKWDGKLPAQMFGGAVPFISVGK